MVGSSTSWSVNHRASNFNVWIPLSHNPLTPAWGGGGGSTSELSSDTVCLEIASDSMG